MKAMAPMKVLVFGRDGQVARELARRKPAGVELVSLSRTEADLTDPESCARRVAEHDSEVVIIAAAFTGVDAAEAHADEAKRVNARAPAAIARACRDQGRVLLHLSTDYVFDGQGQQPWRPEDLPAPLGVYGRTKLAGEEGVLQAMPDATILRTSWVFSAHGRNFVKTMLGLGRERSQLRVVDDQVGGPTAAADIAGALYAIAETRTQGRGAPGIFHFAGQPAVSWADFARTIFESAGQEVAVESIPTSAYPTPAARPLNSRLNGTSTTETFGITMPDWRPALRQVIAELEPLHD
jgi:dTDP-4-dehydrorhamnose reductase